MNNSKDGFKWFGEGFDGFPKTLPEDCLEYSMYVIEQKLNDLEKRKQLRDIQSAGLKLTRELTKDFIWQRESINFSLEREGGESFIHGRTNYGDSVEDEWLVVYILRELSKMFPQIWTRLTDADGQFLLVEAAGVLPKWLNPEIADYRVWLNNGRLLIIGLNELELQTKHAKSLTLRAALNFIEHHSSKMIESPKIQTEAFYRLQKYPEQIMNNLHYTVVMLPRRLAYILHQNPSYISPAVEAFYLRDPIALRPLQAPNPDGLMFPALDFVKVSIKLTKVGFAQLKSQQFDQPKAWGKGIASETHPKMRKEVELGMKITSAFEMMISDPQNQDKKAVREIKLLLEDLEEEECSLPTDETIKTWGMREDDEKWLDISFEEFEKELVARDPLDTRKEGTFGDKSTQEDFRKMVSRLNQFLSDDAAGIEGAEYRDTMDEDEDEDEEEDDTLSGESEPPSENQDISFNEDEFTSMISKMTGMPSGKTTLPSSYISNPDVPNDERSPRDLTDYDADKDLREDMHAIEKELQEAGVFQLKPRQESRTLAPPSIGLDAGPSEVGHSARSAVSEDADNEDVDVDFNLAENLLQSFKSQGGAPGPGGNLMGLMGMHIPHE